MQAVLRESAVTASSYVIMRAGGVLGALFVHFNALLTGWRKVNLSPPESLLSVITDAVVVTRHLEICVSRLQKASCGSADHSLTYRMDDVYCKESSLFI